MRRVFNMLIALDTRLYEMSLLLLTVGLLVAIGSATGFPIFWY